MGGGGGVAARSRVSEAHAAVGRGGGVEECAARVTLRRAERFNTVPGTGVRDEGEWWNRSNES